VERQAVHGSRFRQICLIMDEIESFIDAYSDPPPGKDIALGKTAERRQKGLQELSSCQICKIGYIISFHVEWRNTFSLLVRKSLGITLDCVV